MKRLTLMLASDLLVSVVRPHTPAKCKAVLAGEHHLVRPQQEGFITTARQADMSEMLLRMQHPMLVLL